MKGIGDRRTIVYISVRKLLKNAHVVCTWCTMCTTKYKACILYKYEDKKSDSMLYKLYKHFTFVLYYDMYFKNSKTQTSGISSANFTVKP
jgi:hypothetical protein